MASVLLTCGDSLPSVSHYIAEQSWNLIPIAKQPAFSWFSHGVEAHLHIKFTSFIFLIEISTSTLKLQGNVWLQDAYSSNVWHKSFTNFCFNFDLFSEKMYRSSKDTCFEFLSLPVEKYQSSLVSPFSKLQTTLLTMVSISVLMLSLFNKYVYLCI